MQRFHTWVRVSTLCRVAAERVKVQHPVIPDLEASLQLSCVQLVLVLDSAPDAQHVHRSADHHVRVEVAGALTPGFAPELHHVIQERHNRHVILDLNLAVRLVAVEVLVLQVSLVVN